jgi:hypothetical protein
MAKKKTKEVVVKEEAAIVPVMDFEADAGAGFEGADSQSYAIPYLGILQSNSPQVDEDDAQYIDGAKAGMFINSVTKQVWDGKDGVYLIPCTYQRMMVEWVPRDAGGGFRGQHTPESINMAEVSKDESGRFVLENGNFLADTRYHFVLVYDPETGASEPVVISLSSTQIKKSRNWMTLMNTLKIKNAAGKSFTPPSFSHIYKCTSLSEENDKGKWKGWAFQTERMLTNDESDAYVAAKGFRDMVNQGKAQMTVPTEEAPAKDDTPF